MLRLFTTAAIGLCAFAVLLVAVEVRSAEDEHHDDHALWEVAKVYELESGTYTMTVNPVESGHGDEHDEHGHGDEHDEDGGEDEHEDEHESVVFMVVPVSTADDTGIEEAEELAESAWHEYAEGKATGTELHEGDAAYPSQEVVFVAHLEDHCTEVSIDITDAGAYAILFEKSEVAFAVSSNGTAVEAAAESHSDGHEEEEDLKATDATWGNAIAASLVVSLCSTRRVPPMRSEIASSNPSSRSHRSSVVPKSKESLMPPVFSPGTSTSTLDVRCPESPVTDPSIVLKFKNGASMIGFFDS